MLNFGDLHLSVILVNLYVLVCQIEHKDHKGQFNVILPKHFFLVYNFTVSGIMKKFSLFTLISSFNLTYFSIILVQTMANTHWNPS